MRPNFPPSFTPSFLPETLAFGTQFTGSNGTITQDTLGAIDRFVRDCYNAGIWTKLSEVYPFVGIGVNGAMLKLKGAGGALTAFNFVANDYNERGTNGGIGGDGATKYINTNFPQSSLGVTAHLSAYLRETETAFTRGWIAGNTATDFSSIRCISGTQSQGLLGGNAIATGPNQISAGLHAIDRAAANSLNSYFNGTNSATAATNVTPSYGAVNLFLLARNNNGTPTEFTSKRFSFFSIGQSLTAAEHLALYNAVQNLQTNLGRNV